MSVSRRLSNVDLELRERFAHWSRDITEAAQFRMRDLLKSGYMDLVCGFTPSLVRIQ